MKTLLAFVALLALSIAGIGCADVTVDDPDSPPEGTQTVEAPACELTSGDYGGYVACTNADGSSALTVDKGDHSCGGCPAGAACTAVYTGATGVCR